MCSQADDGSRCILVDIWPWHLVDSTPLSREIPTRVGPSVNAGRPVRNETRGVTKEARRSTGVYYRVSGSKYREFRSSAPGLTPIPFRLGPGNDRTEHYPWHTVLDKPQQRFAE